jgi:hypothetical protein
MELRHRLELSVGSGPAIKMTTGQPKFLMTALGHKQSVSIIPAERLLSSAYQPLASEF